MRILQQWLESRHFSQLKKQLTTSTPKRNPGTFSQAERIGILFNASDKSEYPIVNRYIKQLIDKGIRVSALGYFEDKLEHPDFSFNYFNKKNVSLTFQPKGEMIDNFINTRFDILFNLYLEDNLMLSYISALSKANMRIGKYNDNTDYYDLMIDIPMGNGLQYFIDETEKILESINVEKYETVSV